MIVVIKHVKRANRVYVTMQCPCFYACAGKCHACTLTLG